MESLLRLESERIDQVDGIECANLMIRRYGALGAKTSESLMQEYVASDGFHTNLHPEVVPGSSRSALEGSQHGPFRVSALTADDFEPVSVEIAIGRFRAALAKFSEGEGVHAERALQRQVIPMLDGRELRLLRDFGSWPTPQQYLRASANDLNDWPFSQEVLILFDWVEVVAIDKNNGALTSVALYGD